MHSAILGIHIPSWNTSIEYVWRQNMGAIIESRKSLHNK